MYEETVESNEAKKDLGTNRYILKWICKQEVVSVERDFMLHTTPVNAHNVHIVPEHNCKWLYC